MPARPSKRKKLPRDPNQMAHEIMRLTTGEAPPAPTEPDTRNPAAVALGKMGASKGGKARAAKMPKTRRSEIARLAAKARWRAGKRPLQ